MLFLPEACRTWWRKRQALGPRGERAAAAHLRKTGYRILGRNLRNRFGEIDIVAEDRATRCIAIVEVKAGVSENPPPEVHVNRHKQKKLAALASALVNRYGLTNRAIRFDVVGIVWPEGAKKPTRLTHHQNAFQSSG